MKKIINKVGKFIRLAMEHGLIKNLILCLSIVYVLVTYNSQYMAWYDEKVIPILSHFKSNICFIILSIIMIFVAMYDIVKKVNVCYQYDKKVMLLLCTVSGLLFSCRISGNYNYVYWIWIISYVDIIIFFCCVYIIVAIRNKCKIYYRLHCRKDELSDDNKNNKGKDLILNDWPIEQENEDFLKLTGDAKKLTEYIKKLDRKKTWSIAITAPWGTGKSSFMNLMLKNINKDDFEVVTFNPRDSKSFKTIQEDFFTSIACVLSKYDSRCSNMLKNYMASLKLIDDRDIVEKITKFYRIWDKESLKESIKYTFASLDKKVLVLIDDFDRLSKEEILEVLKLIDSNAAFTNLVFLTAYDKEQVNKSLGDSYKTKDACFVDKFFNLEFSIPSRPYSYISRYIEDWLCELLINPRDEEKVAIQRTLRNHIAIFEKYIPTLRDAKRYINQFVLDFQEVRGFVMIDEFLLVQVIKYRYPDQYKSLYKKEYVKSGLYNQPKNILYLKEDFRPNMEISTILKELFPVNQGYKGGMDKKHIYDISSFENYFVNKIYSSLRIRDMYALFLSKWEDVTRKIDEWVTNQDQSKDFMDYLDSLNMDNFENGDIYIRYVEMVAYVACKLPHYVQSLSAFEETILIKNLEGDGYIKKYGLNIDSYKNRLLEIIKNDQGLELIGSLHNKKDEKYIIKDDDIWPFLKKRFIQIAKNPSGNDPKLRRLLYECTDKYVKSKKTSRGIYYWNLDKDCLNAYRESVEKSPRYYIEEFVILDMKSSDYIILLCEPYWEQIFGDEMQFEDFLNECKKKKIVKIDLVWNFWQLYKANDLHHIEYEFQGDVQAEIDNDLVDEVKKLNKMKDIEKEVLKISDNDLLDAEKDKYLTILSKKQKELNEIRLDIVLKKTINDLINNKKQAINKD